MVKRPILVGGWVWRDSTGGRGGLGGVVSIWETVGAWGWVVPGGINCRLKKCVDKKL